MFAVNTKRIDGFPVHPSCMQMSKQRRHCYKGTHPETCSRLCVELWLQHESGVEQRACTSPLVLPCCLPHLMCSGVWWWHRPAQSSTPGQSPLQMQTCCRCRAHTCTELPGYNRLQQKQTCREKNEIAPCLEGDGEGWRTERESRTGKQLPAFLILHFFQMVLCFLQQCERCCWGAEREEGGINRKVKGTFEKGNSDQGEKTWKCFKANLPLTMGSWPVSLNSLNRLCNLLQLIPSNLATRCICTEIQNWKQFRACQEVEYVFLGTLSGWSKLKCPFGNIGLANNVAIKRGENYFYFRTPQSLVSYAGSINELPFQKFVQKLSPQCSSSTVWKPGKKTTFQLKNSQRSVEKYLEAQNLCLLKDLHSSGRLFFLFYQTVIHRHPHQNYSLRWDSARRPGMLTVWLSCTSFWHQERNHCSVYCSENLTLILWVLAAFCSSMLLLQVGIICMEPVSSSVLDPCSEQWWTKYIVKIMFKRQ